MNTRDVTKALMKMDKNGRLCLFTKFMGNFLDMSFACDLRDALDELNFFNVPASIKYHGNSEGGLFVHSYMVAQNLMDLTNNMMLEWDREESPIIVGMFHDICKTDLYVKKEDSDIGWVYNQEMILPGHGEKSVIMAQKILDLTDEEIICIRWHMGAFDNKENWDHYGYAIEKYPNVLWTHTADMVTSRINGI